jgi:hypothetical protein
VNRVLGASIILIVLVHSRILFFRAVPICASAQFLLATVTVVPAVPGLTLNGFLSLDI